MLLPGCHSLSRLRDDGITLSILLDCRVSLRLPRKDDAGIGRRRCLLVVTVNRSCLCERRRREAIQHSCINAGKVICVHSVNVLPGRHSLGRLRDDGITLSILLDCHVSLRLPRKNDAGMGRRCRHRKTMQAQDVGAASSL